MIRYHLQAWKYKVKRQKLGPKTLVVGIRLYHLPDASSKPRFTNPFQFQNTINLKQFAKLASQSIYTHNKTCVVETN